ncbi:uncharacterized protein ACA1_343150, partial [Acanthamoeba castellanii str. Neff]
WRRLYGPALVLILVVAVTTARGLDVVKSRQDGLEASVVRDGAVAPSFSAEASPVAPDWMPWPFLSSIFSPFTRLYEEHAPQSHFLVRHHAPIEVTNFGVVDGLGQISRTDPLLKVSTTLKSSSGINSEAVKEKDEGGLYVYHLELDYECNEEDPVKRLVVVQLREQAGDAPSDQQVETAPKLTFMFRKQCPLPRPAPLDKLVLKTHQKGHHDGSGEAEEWPVTALFTTWRDGLRGGSLLIASPSSSLGEESIYYRFRWPALMVVVDEAQQQEGYGHARAPVEAQQRHQTQRPAETARREMLRSFFNMPLWLTDALIVIGMATIAIAAVMLVVDLSRLSSAAGMKTATWQMEPTAKR